MMEEGETTLDDGNVNCDFADNDDDNHLPGSSADFVDVTSNAVSELPFVKHHEHTFVPVNQPSDDDRLAVSTVSMSDDAQLELAVEDDGMAVVGDEELGHENRIRADEDDNDQAYMYVANGGDTQAFDDDLLPSQNMLFSKHLNDDSQETTGNEGNNQDIFSKVSEVFANSNLQPSTLNSSAEPSSTSAAPPLGSSKNPIRIIQQGNKYTSMQELTQEQLSQIMQVIQQQQLISSNKSSSVLYNPATQTKIVYRVVYPPDIHKGARSVATSAVGKSTYRRKLIRDDADSDSDKKNREEKRKRLPRTRSGRKCRPPSYMVKDYKHIHPVDFDVNDNDNSDGGYSDFRESSEEDAEAGYGASEDVGDGDGTMMSKVSDDSTIQYAASGKPKSFKCSVCNKCYVGRGGLARHFRLQPTHGHIEDLPEAGNSSDSFQSGSMSSSTPCPAASTSVVAATTFSGMIKPDSLTSDISPTNGVDTPDNEASSDVKITNVLDESSDATLDRSGATEPSVDTVPSALPKRRRGRPPAPHHLQAEKRKEKLRELVMQCSAEELAEVVFPCLVPSLTMWQYLSLRADSVSRSVENEIDDTLSDSGFTDVADKSPSNVDLAVLLDEYAALHREVQNMCNEKLDVELIDKPVDDASGCENDPVKSEPSCLVNNMLHTHSSLTTMNNNFVNNETSEQNVTNDLNVSRTAIITYQETNDAQVNCIDTAVITVSETSSAKADEQLSTDDAQVNYIDTAVITVSDTSLSKADEQLSTDDARVNYIDTSVITVSNTSTANGDKQPSTDAVKSGDFTSTAELNDTTVVDSTAACDRVQVGGMCDSDSQEASAANNREAPASVDMKDGVSTSQQITSGAPAAVVLDSDALKIASKELAHCLGLTVGLRYRVKEKLVPLSQKTSPVEAEEDGMSITAAITDHVQETLESSNLISPTLPLRKRLKLSQSAVTLAMESKVSAANGRPTTSSITNSDLRSVTASSVTITQVPQSTELIRKVVMSPTIVPSRQSVLESVRRSVNSGKSSLSSCNIGFPRLPNDTRQKMMNPSSQMLQLPIGSATMARQPRHAAVTVPSGAQHVVRAPTLAAKRGRRSQPMMSVLRPDVFNRAAVQPTAAPDFHGKDMLATMLEEHQQQMANAGMYDTSVSASYSIAQPAPVAYTGSSSVTGLMPGVIHIDENAKVMQTDDGMIIVCNPDGTIQIHGHTEGQPIPLDAVKALLGLDEMQHTLVAVNEGGDDQMSSSSAMLDTSQHAAMLNLNVNNQTMMPVDAATQALFGVCAGGQPLMTLDGTQTLVSMDGTQSYLTVDGNGQTLVTVDGQTLVGIDPSQAATLVTLDDGQTYMALDVGSLVTMDCGQNAAVIGMDGQELIGIESGQSML